MNGAQLLDDHGDSWGLMNGPPAKRPMLYGMSLVDEEKGRYLVKSYEVAEFKKK
jgi:hypothetical protein